MYQRPDGDLRLAALTCEAGRRGISYGKLISSISPQEQEKIIRKFAEADRRLRQELRERARERGNS